MSVRAKQRAMAHARTTRRDNFVTSAPSAHLVQRHSTWLPRAELLRALEHFGWTGIEVGFDEPDHPNGPALALVASRAELELWRADEALWQYWKYSRHGKGHVASP
jgi:hypothetical protein